MKTIIIDSVEYNLVRVDEVPEPPENILQYIEGKRLEWKAEEPKEMTWNDAMELYKDNPEGWRLPTRVELLQAYVDGVGGFASLYYWSSSEHVAGNAWVQVFLNGDQFDYSKFDSYRVRAVREISNNE